MIVELNNEINNMGISVKINVQLLSRKNDLQIKIAIKDLVDELYDVMTVSNIEVDEDALEILVNKNLYKMLLKENERLFKAEFKLINQTNCILRDRMEQILTFDNYQASLVNMEAVINQFKEGINRSERLIDLQDKIENLTYELAVKYHLHSDIKLYMRVKRVVEDYKNGFNRLLTDSLNRLAEDNLDNSLKMKDTIGSILQEEKYQQYQEEEDIKINKSSL